MPLHLPRRAFLSGLASLLAAPAIVPASSLMPVRALKALAGPIDFIASQRTVDGAFSTAYDVALLDDDLALRLIPASDFFLDPAARGQQAQYDAAMVKPHVKIGSQLRIRILPNGYTVP